jgi:hypothetical protein
MIEIAKPKFRLGKLVSTPGALAGDTPPHQSKLKAHTPNPSTS